MEKFHHLHQSLSLALHYKSTTAIKMAGLFSVYIEAVKHPLKEDMEFIKTCDSSVGAECSVHQHWLYSPLYIEL